MLDIKEYEKKLLSKYGIHSGDEKTEILKFFLGDFGLDLEEKSFSELREIFNSNSIDFYKDGMKINLTKEDSPRCTDHKFLYINMYMEGQNGYVLKKSIFVNSSLNLGQNVNVLKLAILDINDDGSVFLAYANIDRKGKNRVNLRYYNAETTNFLSDAKYDIDTYYITDDLCVFCDDYIYNDIDRDSMEDVLSNIDNMKNQLMDKISLKIGA